MDNTKPSQILSYLYLGNKQNAKNKEALLKYKIKYILNCTPKRTDDPENGCPNYYEKDKTFIYKRIPIFDNRGEDLISYMNIAYNFIEESKHYGNILVHCHKGISRSASFVIGYLMRKNEFTLDEALSHVQSCRSIVQPNPSFMIQLTNYQQSTTTVTILNDHNNSNLVEPSVIGPSCFINILAPQLFTINTTTIATSNINNDQQQLLNNNTTCSDVIDSDNNSNTSNSSFSLNNICSEPIVEVLENGVVEEEVVVHETCHKDVEDNNNNNIKKQKLI